jgi:glycosyltransferase involved in cell wall biosynthesis
MRIAHLSQYFQPKIGYNDLYLPLKQQEMGHEVCVITSDRYMPNTRFFRNVMTNRIIGTGTFREEGILTYRLPCFLELENYAPFVLGIRETLSAYKPDVVHCHDIISPFLVAAALTKRTMKHILVVDSVTGTFQPEKIKKIVYSFYKRILFLHIERKVDVFLAVTSGAREWLVEELGVDLERIELIPFGADMNLFTRDPARRKEVRTLLGIADDDVLLVYSGKILPEKDLATLIRAVALLPLRTRRRVKMLIVGSGPENHVDEISQLARDHGILDKMILRPPVRRTELPAFYSAADVGVWPGTPSNSIIEAMSSNLPIIIVDYSSKRREYDTSGYLANENGQSFKEGNVKELSTAIQRLADDDRLRGDMGRRGRQLVEEKLNWKTISIMTTDAYERAMH